MWRYLNALGQVIHLEFRFLPEKRGSLDEKAGLSAMIQVQYLILSPVRHFDSRQKAVALPIGFETRISGDR